MAQGQGMQCSWHAEAPAQWNCTQCHKLFCKTCSPKPPQSYGEPRCPLCHRELKYLGAAQYAEPFWRRLNDFFIYPFKTQTMLFLLVTSMLGVTLASQSIFAALMSIVLTASITKYTYRIIEYMSNGRWEPPSIAEAFTGGGFHLLFKQIAVFIVIGAAIIAAGYFGGLFIAGGVTIFAALALPASVMVLAREDSLIDAIHPGKLFGIMMAIGWPYLLLFFFIILLYGGSGAFLALLDTKVSDSVLFPISVFSSSYFTCVMSALMGYCLFQYQDALGYTTESAADAHFVDEETWHYQKALAESSIFFQEGRLEDCAEALRAGLKRKKKDPELSRRLFEMRAIGSSKEKMAHEAEQYLELLARRGQYTLAAEALIAIRNREPTWKPENPESRYNAARGLMNRGLFRDTVLILKDMHVQAPDYPKIPQAYLLMAQTLSDGLRRDESALKILSYVQKRFPENSVSCEIAELAEALGKSMEKPQAVSA